MSSCGPSSGRREHVFRPIPETKRRDFWEQPTCGVYLRTVQELGGWTELKTVGRYSQLSPKHKAETMMKTLEKCRVMALRG